MFHVIDILAFHIQENRLEFYLRKVSIYVIPVTAYLIP